MSSAHRSLTALVAKVSFAENNTKSARNGAVQAHLPVTGADLSITARSRVNVDLVELHGAVEQSGQIARQDVFVAAAQAARPHTGGAKGFASVAAIMSILSTNL